MRTQFDRIREVESLVYDVANATRLCLDAGERAGPGSRDRAAFEARDFAADMADRLARELMSAVLGLLKDLGPASVTREAV